MDRQAKEIEITAKQIQTFATLKQQSSPKQYSNLRNGAGETVNIQKVKNLIEQAERSRDSKASIIDPEMRIKITVEKLLNQSNLQKQVEEKSLERESTQKTVEVEESPPATPTPPAQLIQPPLVKKVTLGGSPSDNFNKTLAAK